jgi:hypothetical protein|tara:strand:- start:246 stop:509 length:264 start_codon:yes stop_codon:yes gene_type:complete
VETLKCFDKVIAIEKQIESVIQDLDKIIENDSDGELFYERVDRSAMKKILENIRETFDRSEYSESKFMGEFLYSEQETLCLEQKPLT